MHEGLWLCSSTEGDGTEGEEDIEDAVVFSGWIACYPGRETSVAGFAFDPEMFLHGERETVQWTDWFV